MAYRAMSMHLLADPDDKELAAKVADLKLQASRLLPYIQP